MILALMETSIDMGKVFMVGGAFGIIAALLYFSNRIKALGKRVVGSTGGTGAAESGETGLVPSNLPAQGSVVTIQHPKREGWFINGTLLRYGAVGQGSGTVLVGLFRNPTLFKPPTNGKEAVTEKKPSGDYLVFIGPNQARDVWEVYLKEQHLTATDFADQVNLGSARADLYKDFVGGP